MYYVPYSSVWRSCIDIILGFMQITSGAGRVRSAMMVIRRQIRMGRHPGPRTARSMVLAITGDITRNLEDDK